MADLVRWDPFREAMSLREAMDRLFEDSFVRPLSWFMPVNGASVLPLDMFETDEEVVVRASVPGVDPKDIDISVTGDVLTIQGTMPEDQEGNYYLRERRCGAFRRSISLPVPVDTDKAKAEYEHGVLTLTLPKAEEAKPKAIQVKAK